MIFPLHYILFNAGMPAILVLLTLFLQTYSSASLSEIGALLMALPFVSILVKPLFCALADRRQAHRQFLMVALGAMALGYGSLTVAPFFPEFVRQNGRLVWYLDVCGVVLGFSAFGVVWSLGDALAVNAAQVNGVSWGSYRVWAVVSWGVFGVIIGQINELPFLPKFVPAFFLLVGALSLEIALLAVWPREHFVMGGPASALAASPHGPAGAQKQQQLEQQLSSFDLEASQTGSRGNTLMSAGSLTGGAVRTNPRLIGALANIFMEDLGGTLRSSLKLGAQTRSRRAGLDEVLNQHGLSGACGRDDEDAASTTEPPGQQAAQTAGTPSPAQLRRALYAGHRQAHSAASLDASPPASGRAAAAQGLRRTLAEQSGSSATGGTIGRSVWQRTLSRMNTLSAASGHVIAGELDDESFVCAPGGGAATKNVMYMSSLASNASARRAAAARALGLASGGSSVCSRGKESPLSAALRRQQERDACEPSQFQSERENETRAPGTEPEAPDAPPQHHQKAQHQARNHDLQLVLLKLIVRRDANTAKYLIMFTVFGLLLTVHLSYFFLHLEDLCRIHSADFSSVMGGMMMAHSVSEVISFTLIVPHFVPRVGRAGALLTCALVYAIRFLYYGFYFSHASPFTGVAFELCHGIAYGIIYSLITDIACECVNHIDHYLPELVRRGLVEPDVDPNELKLPLRATMQGVFSGAFDGLGNGIGALFGGLFLDAYSFSALWRVCGYICLAVMLLYTLSEWRALTGRAAPRPQQEHQTPNGRHV